MKGIREDKDQEAARRAYRQVFDSIWEETDRKVKEAAGFRWETPLESRRQVESTFLRDRELQRLDPRRKADQRVLAAAFRQHAMLEVAQAVAALKENLPWMDDRVLQDLRHRPPVSASKVEGERHQTQRAHDRNLELLSFVAERALPRDRLRHGELRPGHRGPAVAVPWEELAQQWNEGHRRPFFESGPTLSRAYYRAVDRAPLRRDFLTEMGRQEFSAFSHLARSFGFRTELEPPIRRRPEAVRRWRSLQSARTWRRYVRSALVVWFMTRGVGDRVPRLTRAPAAQFDHLQPPGPKAVREMNRCLRDCCQDGHLQSYLSAHLLSWFCTQKHSGQPIRAVPQLSAADLGHPERGSW